MKLTVRILSLFILLFSGIGQANNLSEEVYLQSGLPQLHQLEAIDASLSNADADIEAVLKSTTSILNINDKTEITESEEQEEDLHFQHDHVKLHDYFISSYFVQLSGFTFNRVKNKSPLSFDTSSNLFSQSSLYISFCVYRL